LTALRIAVDVGVPTAAYYVLRAAGVGVYTALLVGAVLSALSGIRPLLLGRRQKLDALGVYMTTMMVGSLLVSLIGGDTRLLLARDAALTGVTGIWFLVGSWTRRPLAYTFTKPLVEGRFHWPRDWETLWERSPRWRRMWRVSSFLFGIGTLGDAIARVVMAYTLNPDLVPALGTALYAATSVLLIIVNNVYYFASGVHNRGSAMYREAGLNPW
jgi:hypothetical protein